MNNWLEFLENNNIGCCLFDDSGVRYIFFQVKFSIAAYNACILHSSTFNDKMVDLVASMIQREAVNSVLWHFREGIDAYMLIYWAIYT